ncbi:Rieske 2Fe-2S domain-containing protein [Pseudenhygromyxa sp. WMMC2535]|uniref:Rieske (2Fe-2S) protein n=1 Tax=Pseudenhygromyxa sp. WMMC2535 TaxID=2712867 RepID=UPI0015582EBE|nr:Rieske 2Fe-2S domain-containing protein [Pseudenhygromyxa sp. WMMC2535]NVB39719.1 Rieske 2Fe-2S domain-containing protein [Pseudenhygromyxa sp. WMMC2535]
MTQIRVEAVASLAIGEVRVFDFERDGEAFEGFVVRHQGGLSAFLNRCPHWNVDLDMGERRFYSRVVGRIFCVNHGALFEPSSGYCESGPCLGASLERFELRLEGEHALVEVPGAKA